MALGEFHSATFPWQDSPTDVEYAAAEAALGTDDRSRIDQIMSLLSDRIESFNADASLAEKQEAASRWHADLLQAPTGGRKSIQTGSISLEIMPDSRASFFRSGAAAVLSRNRPALAAIAGDE